MFNASKSRMAAAARNHCTTMTTSNLPCHASFEWKKTFATSGLEIDECAICRKPNPTQFFVVCPEHMACEDCHNDAAKYMKRSGKCAGTGCTHKAPDGPLVFNLVLTKALGSVKVFKEKALQAINVDDIRYQTQKERAEQEKKRAEAAAVAAEAAKAAEAAAEARAVAAEARAVVGGNNKRKCKDDYTHEEWEQMKTDKKMRKAQRDAEAKRVEDNDIRVVVQKDKILKYMRAENPEMSDGDILIMYDDEIDDEIDEFKIAKAAFNGARPRDAEMDVDEEGEQLD